MLAVLLATLLPFAQIAAFAGDPELSAALCTARHTDHDDGSTPAQPGAAPTCPMCLALAVGQMLQPRSGASISPTWAAAEATLTPAEQRVPPGTALPTARARGPPTVL